MLLAMIETWAKLVTTAENSLFAEKTVVQYL